MPQHKHKRYITEALHRNGEATESTQEIYHRSIAQERRCHGINTGDISQKHCTGAEMPLHQHRRYITEALHRSGDATASTQEIYHRSIAQERRCHCINTGDISQKHCTGAEMPRHQHRRYITEALHRSEDATTSTQEIYHRSIAQE